MSEMSNCSCRTHKDRKNKTGWWYTIFSFWKKSRSRNNILQPFGKKIDDVDRSLGLAIQEGRSDDVKAILRLYPTMRIDGTYETVLFMALHRGMFCIVDWLVERGIQAEALNEAFILASKRGEIVTAERLLDAGACVNARNRYGSTAMHFVAEHGDAVTLSKLLKRGADPSFADSDGRTPIQYAVRACSIDSIKVLTEAGANLKCADNNKCSLLHEAMKRQIVFGDGDDITIVRHPKKKYLEMISFLLNNIPNVSESIGNLDGTGNSCLHHAAQNLCAENLEALHLLVHAGSPINLLNGDGMSPLRISVHKQNVPVARTLIKLGADIDVRAPDGSTPLHAAATMQNVAIVNLLLENGADVDAQTSDGVTPFQIALYWPSNFSILMVPGSVISLMQYGANIFFSAGYRPNPFANKDVSHLLFEPLNCILPILIYAIRDCKNSMPNAKGSDSTFEKYSNLFYFKCVNEITAMSNERIGNTTYYKLLVCNTDQFIKYLRNQSVVDVLESSCHLSKFEVYGILIETRYKRCLKRKKLLNSGINFFNSVFQRKGRPILPEECALHVLDYLKDSHLKIMEVVVMDEPNIRGTVADMGTSLLLGKVLELHQNCLERLEQGIQLDLLNIHG